MIVTVDPPSPAPVYEQIVTQVSAAIRSGDLPAGTRLPTVRQLAGDLGLAVNTVAKAYKQLEADGLVTTRGRNGTVVSPRAHTADEETRAAAVLLVRAAQRGGLGIEQVGALLREVW